MGCWHRTDQDVKWALCPGDHSPLHSLTKAGECVVYASHILGPGTSTAPSGDGLVVDVSYSTVGAAVGRWRLRNNDKLVCSEQTSLCEQRKMGWSGVLKWENGLEWGIKVVGSYSYYNYYSYQSCQIRNVFIFDFYFTVQH